MRILAAVMAAATLAAAPAAEAQMRADALGDSLLAFVDFETMTQQTVQACRPRAPEWINPIQTAYRDWRERHGKAQKDERMLFMSRLPAGTAGAPDPVPALQQAMRSHFNATLAAMDKEALLKFCREYAQQFANPAMNFTERFARASAEASQNKP